jgi:2-polyprenyl-3-methyl-5-hydroxy-6-metoxy-1,4-benzoquinol methylase
MSVRSSSVAIYEAVASALRARTIPAGALLDVGCGKGDLRNFVEQFAKATSAATPFDTTVSRGCPVSKPTSIWGTSL